MKRKAVTLQLEGEIPQSQSAYDVAVEEGYEGSEEQYGKELATIPPTQEQFDAIPGRLSKLTTTTEKSDFHHITDSAADKVVYFGMEGKTEQETTPGNQLFDKDSIAILYGLLQNNGSAISNNNYVHTDFIEVVSNETYTVNVFNSTYNYSGVWIYDENKTFVSKVESSTGITIPENAKYVMIGFVKSVYGVFTEAEMLELSESIMLVKGSTKPTTYEPYTNGASPNPDYPQEIVNAGVYNEATGRYEIGCVFAGKNIIDKNEWIAGLIEDITVGASFSMSTSSRYYCIVTSVPKNTNLYFDMQSTDNASTFRLRAVLVNENGIITAIRNRSSNTKHDWNVNTGDACKLAINLLDLPPEDVDVKVNLVSESDFDGYQVQPFTLTSPVPLTKWDYLTKRDGVWGWSIWSYEDFNDGSADEAWRVANRTTSGVFFVKTLKVIGELGLINSIGTAVSDRFIETNPQSAIGNYTLVKGATLRTGLSDDNITTVDEFKAFIAEHPFKVLYKTNAEQAFHPLPDEEQTLLNNLETYYGVTNLYNDQGCPMWLTYVQDTKTAVDNKFNNIKTALLSLGANI